MPERILIVEDDKLIQEAVTLKLKDEGFETAQASDGEKALELLRNNGPFHAVLLDLRIPKIDGFKLMEEKAKDEKIKDIPVIVFTNISQLEFVSRALSLGAKGYLIKAHHSLQETVEELKKALKGQPVIIDR